mgnify:CR=1 FL=1
MTDLEIHLGSDAPVYQQIVEQVKRQIAAGKLVPGAQLPTVRDLAHRLRLNPSTVAKAYVELERQGVLLTRRGGGSFVADFDDDRFLASVREERLSQLLGRAVLEALSLGFPPEEVEASFALQMARWRESRSSPQFKKEPRAAPAVRLGFVGSHDLAVELLLGQVQRSRPDLSVSTTWVGSLAGLVALERGEAHLAGCHLLDEETHEYNLPYVRRLLPTEEVVLVTVAERLQGLMVRKGNPEAITGVAHLARSGVRFVNRQRGSGTRVLLDLMLRQLGIRPTDIAGYDREEETHLGVALAVAEGRADVGMGIYAAARSLGLDFVPLQTERYDLAMLRSTFDSAAFEPVRAMLEGEEFRRVVAAMGGYDVSNTGKVTCP